MAQSDDEGAPDSEHEEAAAQLRDKVEELVKQARLLLHGEAQAKPSPRPLQAKRAEREQELEKALEKADWYRHEIKRLQKELEIRGAARGGGNPIGDPQERDPMELQNLLTEKRKELQRLKRSGEGLDRIAEAQRRAEAAQNSMTPEKAERLKFVKDEVEQQKRLNVKLFSERQKLVSASKKAEAQVRAAEQELKNKASELRLPPRPPGDAAPHRGRDVAAEPQALKQLQRDVDILKEALRQDERKFQAEERAEDQDIETATSTIQELQKGIAEHETEVARLRAELRDLAARDPVGRGDFTPKQGPSDEQGKAQQRQPLPPKAAKPG